MRQFRTVHWLAATAVILGGLRATSGRDIGPTMFTPTTLAWVGGGDLPVIVDFVPVDWDEDGDDDLIIGALGGQLFLLENQEGVLTHPRLLVPGPMNVGLLECGDLNGDGRADLLIGQSIWFRQGDSLEQGPTLSLTGQRWIADLDGDDDLDVFGGTVYLNDGAGTFQIAQIIGSDVDQLLADLDGDDDLDILSSNGVWINASPGLFDPRPLDVNGSAPGRILAASDVSGDGRADFVYHSGSSLWLATAIADAPYSVTEIGPALSESVITESYRGIFQDMTGDGRADLIVLPGLRLAVGPDRIRPLLDIYQVTGDGVFTPRPSVPTGLLPYSGDSGLRGIRSGNMDGDAATDVLAGDLGGIFPSGEFGEVEIGSVLHVVPGRCHDHAEYTTGSTIGQRLDLRGGEQARLSTFLTVNGRRYFVSSDGYQLYAVARRDDGAAFETVPTSIDINEDVVGVAATGDAGTVLCLTRSGLLTTELVDVNGEAGWTLRGGLLPIEFPQSLTVADFNQDGSSDAAVGHTTEEGFGRVQLVVRDEQGDFALGLGIEADLRDVHRIASGDVDGDGHPDLLATGRLREQTSGPVDVHGMQVLFGDGQGGFSPGPVSALRAEIQDLVTVNIDDVGANEVVALTRFPAWLMILEVATGVVIERQVIPQPRLIAGSLVLGDPDLDGDTDVGIVRTSAVAPLSAQFDLDWRVGLFENTVGVLSWATDVGTGEGPEAAYFEDMDEDGDADLVTLHTVLAYLSVSMNRRLVACAEDLDADGLVSFADLQVLLEHWGASDVGCPTPDIDRSGVVGFPDLNLLLDAWGTACP